MNSCFAVSYMVLVIVGVISLSINMLRVSTIFLNHLILFSRAEIYGICIKNAEINIFRMFYIKYIL